MLLHCYSNVGFERAPYVYMNDQRAAYEIVEQLWDLGHRRIAYLGFKNTGASKDRYAGYSQFFRDKGLAPPTRNSSSTRRRVPAPCRREKR